MEFAEFTRWRAYIRRYGPLCPARRIESSLALLMMYMTRIENTHIHDFMPFHRPEPLSIEAQIEMARREWV